MKHREGIPSFLRPYESLLEKYRRDFIKINAYPILESNLLNDSLGLKSSKLLGKPFFPSNKDYPVDSDGKKMIMIAQINFIDTPNILDLPEDGLLQLFLSPHKWYDEEAKIFYHSNDDLNSDYIKDFSFLNVLDFENLPVLNVHELSFESAIEYGGSEDCQFEISFNGKDHWDFSEELNEIDQKTFDSFIDASGNKIGGYAEFAQSDPRDYNSSKRNDFQLLQLDTSEYIMFGDMGLGHLFIDKKYLLKRDFEKTYFYWDCH